MTSLALLSVLMLLACCAIVPGGGQDIDNSLSSVNPNNELAKKALQLAVEEIDDKDKSNYWRLPRKTGRITGATVFKFSNVQLVLTTCTKKVDYADIHKDICRFRKRDVKTCSFKVIQPVGGGFSAYKLRDLDCMQPVYAPKPKSSKF